MCDSAKPHVIAVMKHLFPGFETFIPRLINLRSFQQIMITSRSTTRANYIQIVFGSAKGGVPELVIIF